MKQLSPLRIVLITITILIMAAYFVVTRRGANSMLLEFSIPIICLLVIYIALRMSRHDGEGATSNVSQGFRVGLNVRLAVVIAFTFGICALAWPVIAMTFVNRNSMSGVLIVFAPALFMATISGYCVVRILLYVMGGWYDGK